MVFEAEASEGEVRQVVSPTLPFPLSLPSYFPFPLSFQTNQWEGRSDPVRGKFPGFPPTNTALLISAQLRTGAAAACGRQSVGNVLLSRAVLGWAVVRCGRFVINE